MGGAGRAGPALAMPDGNCSFGYENQVGGGTGSYISGRGSGYGGPRGAAVNPRAEGKAVRAPLLLFLCSEREWC